MDSYTFWKLVAFLPAYQGATKLAIKIIQQGAGKVVAERESVSVDAPLEQAISTMPIVAASPTPAKEIQAEALNGILGGNPLISWGKPND